MIVKNEERYLAECLDSVKDIADEIVIVDTGSTDSTVAIAEKYNAKIILFPWCNDFSAARNEALRNSTGDYILYLDADERVTKESKHVLKKIIQEKREVGYSCILRNRDEQGGRPSIMRYVRLFANSPKIRFEGRVHEQILNSLTKNNYPIEECNVELLHIGYDVPLADLKKKAVRNIELLLIDYEETPSGYVAFQLGQSYAILENRAVAFRFFSEAVNYPNLLSDYFGISYRYMAAELLHQKKYKEALSSISQALLKSEKQPLVQLIASKVYFALGEKSKAVEHTQMCYEYNLELLAGKIYGSYDMYIAPKELIYHFIELAIEHNVQEMFNYAVTLLKNLPKNYQAGDDLEAVRLIVSEKPITKHDYPKIIALLNERTFNSFKLLFTSQRSSVEQEEFYERCFEKLGQNIEYLTSYANFEIAKENYPKAESLIALGLKTNEYYLPLWLMSISAGVAQGKMTEVKEKITRAKGIFKNDFYSRGILENVEQKLNGYLNQ